MDAGRPRVAPLVRAAHRALAAHRSTEAVLFGVTAALLVVASAVVSAGQSGPAIVQSAAAWGAGALAGLLCALGWWGEHRRSEVDAARRLDRALGRGGAVLTAFELEARGRADAVAHLLSARALARVDRRAARRALVPGIAAAVAAPLFGAAVLALALEVQRAEGTRGVASLHMGGVAAALAGASDNAVGRAGSDLTDAQARALVAAGARAEELQAALERDGADSEDVGAALLELERGLEEFGGRLEPGDPLREDLDRARLLAGAARASLGGDTEGSAGESGEGAGQASGDALASGGANGTMSARPEGDLGGQSAPRAPEEAGAAGRWWPTRYDDVVAGWLDARRAASDPPPDHHEDP